MTSRTYGIQNRRDRDTGQPMLATVQLDPDNWAHGVWTALAVTIAKPLRKALNTHVAEHCPGDWLRCETAMALYALLPAGDQVMFA